MTKSVLPKLHFPPGVQEGSAERGNAFSFRVLDYSILDFRF